MSFLKKIFGKQNHEISPEEVVKVEDLVYKAEEFKKVEDNSDIELSKNKQNEIAVGTKKDLDVEVYISNIGLNSIKKFRDLLDKREKELTGNNFNSNTSKNKLNLKEKPVHIENINPGVIGEINVEERVTEEDLNASTYTEEMGDLGLEMGDWRLGMKD